MPKILDNVKETILNEGKKLLIEKSYKHFNMRELALRCDISVGTLYNNFPTKKELITGILMGDWNNAVHKMENINTDFSNLHDKLAYVYSEMNDYLSTYINIFYELSGYPHSHIKPNSIHYLYDLILNILSYEAEKNRLKSTLSVDKLAIFIINNFTSICTNKVLTFEEAYSLMNL
ncbi:MAG: TetR/AcrR family transcriptional regulator [Cellulosilyticaceae bacterium]